MSKATHGLSFPSHPQISPLSPPPEEFSGVLESVSLIFSPWPGKPWHMVRLPLQTLLSPLLPFSKCTALFHSRIHSISVYWKRTMRQMVALRTEWLARQMRPLTSCCPQSGLFQSLHAVPSIHKGQVTGSSPHSSSSATFPSTLGWHSRHWAASWAIIMDTNCQPPVSQSSKLYFYPAIALVRGHPARGTTQMLKYSKSVLHVFLPYPPPTLPTALTPTNTCKYACELPKGKNLF